MNRKPKTVAFWTGRLPHWEVEDGRYFITIHLAGAIPLAGRNEIRATAEQLRVVTTKESPDWLQLQRRIFSQMEEWLNRAQNNVWLKDPSVAEMVVESIEHRQQRGDWNMFSYVIMPNHLHLFCELAPGEMKTVITDFKRWTGHEATKLIADTPKRFWQREWFDHWSRSDEEDDRIVTYIERNPEAAGLVRDYKDWPFGSW